MKGGVHLPPQVEGWQFRQVRLLQRDLLKAVPADEKREIGRKTNEVLQRIEGDFEALTLRTASSSRIANLLPGRRGEGSRRLSRRDPLIPFDVVPTLVMSDLLQRVVRQQGPELTATTDAINSAEAT